MGRLQSDHDCLAEGTELLLSISLWAPECQFLPPSGTCWVVVKEKVRPFRAMSCIVLDGDF